MNTRKYPIEQSDIDNAIEKLNNRKLQRDQLQEASMAKSVLKPKKRKKTKKRKFFFNGRIKELDAMMDYAIWKDK